MSQLRVAVRNRDVDVVVAHALDRLTRNQTHQGLLLSEAEHAEVSLEFVTERLEDTPEGRLLLSVRAFVAEIERVKIAERTQRGKRARVESGKYNVGCRAPYGYQWADHTKARLIPNPDTAPVVQRIFRDLATGVSARQLSIKLNAEAVPTPSSRARAWYWSTIRVIVNNPVYFGEARAYRWSQQRLKGRRRITRRRPLDEQVAVPDAAPALVTREVAIAALDRLAVNKSESTRNNKSPQSALLRAGYAKCGYCGNNLEVTFARGGWMYRCSTHHRDQHHCPYFSIMTHKLDDAVWGCVERILRDPQVIAHEVERLRQQDPTVSDLAAIDRRIEEVRRQTANLGRRLAQFDDDDAAAPIVAEIKSLTAQANKLEEDRRSLFAQRTGWERAQLRLSDLEYWIGVQAANLLVLGYEQKRLALHALNVRATVWAQEHSPRFLVSMEPEGLIPVSVANGLRSDADGDLAGARVDDYIRRGCARRGGRRADRP